MKDDLRRALRSLRRQPGFAVVVVLTLALGIGVNTSLFSLLDAFFLQPLAVEGAQDLVVVMQRGELINVPYGHSYADYLDFRQGATTLSGLAAFMPTPVHLGAPGQTPERTWIEVVSPNYFELARVRPGRGSLLRSGEGEGPGADPTIVLTHRYWERRFGSDPSLVGRLVTINGHGFRVIGIAPESFTGLSWAMAVSGFVPAGAIGSLMDGGEDFLTSRGAHAFRMMGRLAPGRSLADARADLEVVARRLYAAYPGEHKGSKVIVVPESRSRPDPSVAEFLPIFAAIFSAMVALVLFIACANVANLMLSRAIARRKDLVIRSALGAGRLRLIRLQVVESLVLAGMAGVLGIVLARVAGPVLAGFAPAGDVPVNTEHGWDWRIYAFTVVVSALAGIAAGLWPALEASRFHLTEALKEGGGAGTGGARHPVLNLLVVGQVMLSVVVLACAGLFGQSLRRMQGMALGFRADDVLMMSLDLGRQRYPDARGRQFLDSLLERAAALPGVRGATLTQHVPFDYGMQITEVSTGGDLPGSKDGYVSSAFTIVGPDFFQTMGTALTRGRVLDRRDDAGSRRVAVVNATMARTFWPGRDPVGQRFRFGRGGDWIEVVGVAEDGKYVMMAEAPRTYFYLPLAQNYRAPITLMLRTAGDPGGLARPVQELIRQMDPDLPVFNVRTMDRHIRESIFALMPLRLAATMAAFEGVLGLLLATMGLYAVVAYAARRRVHEIGVRIAIGARPADVVRLVVGKGMRLAVTGLVLGLLVAVGVGFALSHALYGLDRVAASVLVPVAVLLLAVAALACYVPARRATRVDPVTALRCE